MLFPTVTESLKQKALQLVDALAAMDSEDKLSLLKVLSVTTQFHPDAVLLVCTKWKDTVSKNSGVDTEMLNHVARPMIAMRETDEFLKGEGNKLSKSKQAIVPAITESLKHQARQLVDALGTMQSEDKLSLLKVRAITTRFHEDAVLLACTEWKNSVSKKSGLSLEMLKSISDPMIAMRKTDALLAEEQAIASEDEVATSSPNSLFQPYSHEAEEYEKLYAEHDSVLQLPSDQREQHKRAFVVLMFQALERMETPTLPSVLGVASHFPDDIAQLALTRGKNRVMREARVEAEIVEKAADLVLMEDLDKCAKIVEKELETNPNIFNVESMLYSLEVYPDPVVYTLLTSYWCRKNGAPSYIKNIYGSTVALRKLSRAIARKVVPLYRVVRGNPKHPLGKFIFKKLKKDGTWPKDKKRFF